MPSLLGCYSYQESAPGGRVSSSPLHDSHHHHNSNNNNREKYGGLQQLMPRRSHQQRQQKRSLRALSNNVVEEGADAPSTSSRHGPRRWTHLDKNKVQRTNSPAVAPTAAPADAGRMAVAASESDLVSRRQQQRTEEGVVLCPHSRCPCNCLQGPCSPHCVFQPPPSVVVDSASVPVVGLEQQRQSSAAASAGPVQHHHLQHSSSAFTDSTAAGRVLSSLLPFSAAAPLAGPSRPLGAPSYYQVTPVAPPPFAQSMSLTHQRLHAAQQEQLERNRLAHIHWVQSRRQQQQQQQQNNLLAAAAAAAASVGAAGYLLQPTATLPLVPPGPPDYMFSTYAQAPYHQPAARLAAYPYFIPPPTPHSATPAAPIHYVPTAAAQSVLPVELGMLIHTTPAAVILPAAIRDLGAAALFPFAGPPPEPQPIGASNEQIELYTETKFYQVGSAEQGEGDDERCTICLCNFSVEESIRSLGCSHIFHIHCIDRWLVYNKKCPVCRVDMDTSYKLPPPSSHRLVQPVHHYHHNHPQQQQQTTTAAAASSFAPAARRDSV